jgi:2-(1,2-epoxy-1,2-dihydrophenyl)acetyl-CoA isomerase
VLNALHSAALEEFLHALDAVRDGGTARALLLTGAGRAFCAGADLAEPVATDPPDRGAGLERYYNPLLLRLRALPIPVVTAVNGGAAGGGCGFALAGDIGIAAQSAYFLQPFANIGLVPDVGATWLLPRLAGRARAMAMMLLAERVSAQTALDWGMIYQVVPDAELMLTALTMAQRLATGPSRAYGLMRQSVDAALEMSLSDTLALEREHQRVAGRTADHAEGVAAFLAKRKPVFTGK